MQITLSSNAWHHRLQERMFGPVHFTNFCPYFWLTIFCLFASPFFFSYQALKAVLFGWIPLAFEKVVYPVADYTLVPLFSVFVRVCEVLFAGIDTAVCRPLERAVIERMGDEDILDLYVQTPVRIVENYSRFNDEKEALEYMLRCESTRGKKKVLRAYEKFNIWREKKGDKWREELEAIRKAYRERQHREGQEQFRKYREDNEREAQNAARRRERMNAIAMNTQKAAPYFLGLLGLGAAYVGFLFLRFAAKLPWLNVFRFIFECAEIIVLGILHIPVGLWHLAGHFSAAEKGTMMIVPLVGALLIKLSRKCDLTIPRMPWFDRMMTALGGFVIRVAEFSYEYTFGAALSLFIFIVEYVMLFKKNHCPQINWTE